MDTNRLPPFRASAVDVAAETRRFLDIVNPTHAEHMIEHAQALSARFGMAAAPELLRIIRETPSGALGSGATRIRRLHPDDPWNICFVMSRPGARDIAVSLQIKKPMTVESAWELHQLFAKMSHKPIPAPDTPEYATHKGEQMDDYRARGIPETLPPVDSVTTIEKIGFYHLDGYSGGVPEFEKHFSDEHPYWSDKLFDVYVPGTASIEPVLRADVSDPTGWVDAGRMVRAVVDAWGNPANIAEAARKIGDMPTGHYCLSRSDQALERLGAGMALLDDGIPADLTLAVARALEAGGVKAKLQARLPDLETLERHLFENNHTPERGAAYFNDLDISVTINGEPGNSMMDLIATRFIAIEHIAVEGGSRLTAWISRKNGEVQRPGPGEPGFLGVYDISGGQITIAAEPSFGTDEIRSLNMLVTCLDTCAIEIEEALAEKVPAGLR